MIISKKFINVALYSNTMRTVTSVCLGLVFTLASFFVGFVFGAKKAREVIRQNIEENLSEFLESEASNHIDLTE